MKIWDVVDQVHPGVQITEAMQNPGRLVGGLCSAVRVAIVVGAAVVSSGNVRFSHQPSMAGTAGGAIRFVSPRPQASSATAPGLRRGIATTTDTQLGLSKIGRAHV